MSRLELAGNALKGCFANVGLWLLQFFANIILFVFFAEWLRLSVSSTMNLIFNFFLILILLAAALMLHAGTLNQFADRCVSKSSPLWPSFQRALRHLAAVVVCIAVIALLWLAVNEFEALQPNLPPYIRSTLPVFLRRHISLPALDNLFAASVFVLRWIVAPGLILPLLLQASDRGFRGFGRQGFAAWRRGVCSWAYWLVLVAAALLGVMATQALMARTPDFRTSTFGSEAASLSVRLTCAYLLALFSWMLTCSSVGRHATAGSSVDAGGNSQA